MRQTKRKIAPKGNYISTCRLTGTQAKCQANWPKGVKECFRCGRPSNKRLHSKRCLCEPCYWQAYHEEALEVYPRGKAPLDLIRLLGTLVGASMIADVCEYQRLKAVRSAKQGVLPECFSTPITVQMLNGWSATGAPKPFRRIMRRYLRHLGLLEAQRERAVMQGTEGNALANYAPTTYEELALLSPGIDPFSEMLDGNPY